MDEQTESETIERAARILAVAAPVSVLSGAGVSRASGVPTFCGAGGLPKSCPAKELATPASQLADISLYGPAADVLPELV